MKKKNSYIKNSTYVLCGLVSIVLLFARNISAGQIPEERLLPRLIDGADLLTDSEEAKLLERLDEISEKYQTDVVIVTNYSLEGKTSTAYADDFFDYNGYGFGENADGILCSLEYGRSEIGQFLPPDQGSRHLPMPVWNIL